MCVCEAQLQPHDPLPNVCPPKVHAHEFEDVEGILICKHCPHWEHAAAHGGEG